MIKPGVLLSLDTTTNGRLQSMLRCLQVEGQDANMIAALGGVMPNSPGPGVLLTLLALVALRCCFGSRRRQRLQPSSAQPVDSTCMCFE